MGQQSIGCVDNGLRRGVIRQHLDFQCASAFERPLRLLGTVCASIQAGRIVSADRSLFFDNEELVGVRQPALNCADLVDDREIGNKIGPLSDE